MTTQRVFLALVLCRGIGEGFNHSSGWGLLLVGGAVIAAVAGRAGFAVLAVVAFAATLLGNPSASTALVGWVAAAFALFDGDGLAHALRTQVVVLYGFAAAHKAVSPEFTSGAKLVAHASRVAVWPVPMAVATIVLEAGLAWAVWRGWRRVLPVVAVMHCLFVAGIATGPAHAFELFAFNAIMVVLVWAVSPDSGRGGPNSRGDSNSRWRSWTTPASTLSVAPTV